MSARPRIEAVAEALAAELVEPVARRVAELLRESGTGPMMLSAREVAGRLGCSRD